jgi:hypothetical protein
MVGVMSKKRIKKTAYERCLLTEISPYETPLIWSNWGSFNYQRTLQHKTMPKYLKIIFDDFIPSIPYNYYYNKNINKRRLLSIVHPNSAKPLVDIYRNYSVLIIRLCQKSSFSIRRPHSIAKYFNNSYTDEKNTNYIEQLNENQSYASSYFTYVHYSHLHKFFESPTFTRLEKKYQYFSHVDISKCFPSIYTHTIDWAIEGKERAKKRSINSPKKDKAFGRIIDEFIQNVNYKETNGIIIGPEFSRIFAEIILQDIDKKIELELRKNNLYLNKEFFCSRYIDDFYFFYNDENVYKCFLKIVATEIEKYKLYINESKLITLSRPFISNISIKKINVSQYIQDLQIRIKTSELSRIHSEKEINKIRSIFKGNNEDENYAVTNFFLSAITKKMWALKKDTDLKQEGFQYVLKLFIELSFYLVSIDIRVSSVYRITKFIVEVMTMTDSLPPAVQCQLKDKMFYELMNLLKNACISKMIIETMNILVAATEFGDGHKIPLIILEDVVNMCKREFTDSLTKEERLTYFEIITILYYIQDIPEYKDLFNEVLTQSENIFKLYSPKTSSESAHLLLDLISCPFIIKDKKIELATIALLHINNTLPDINYFVNYVSKHSWYTNWNSVGDLLPLLKKKDYISSYV